MVLVQVFLLSWYDLNKILVEVIGSQNKSHYWIWYKNLYQWDLLLTVNIKLYLIKFKSEFY